jgi:N-acetylglucosamine-6-phosphate deacetylase
MRSPDWDEFLKLQRAAGGRIGIVTLAPELPGAEEFIRKAQSAGVIVAISHTDGGPDDVHRAAAAGATLNTHLGNGCPEYLHRHRAPLWAQLATESLHASIICDGFHLPPDVVKVIVAVKGIDKCILITDAVHVAQLRPGRYALVGTEIELLPSGQVVRADRVSMAGLHQVLPGHAGVGDSGGDGEPGPFAAARHCLFSGGCGPTREFGSLPG